MRVQQKFNGLASNFAELNLETDVDGRFPEIAPNLHVAYLDTQISYKVKPNEDPTSDVVVVESNSIIRYKLFASDSTTNGEEFSMITTERIVFNQCGGVLPAESEEFKIYMKELQALYMEKNGETRLSGRSLVVNFDEPCASNDCHPLASCYYDSSEQRKYVCNCKAGFNGDGIDQCIDENECTQNVCPDEADCVNIFGFHDCTCKSGYIGDGRICKLDDRHSSNEICSRCHAYARCVSDNVYGARCECYPGYIGDGYTCRERSKKKNDFIENTLKKIAKILF